MAVIPSAKTIDKYRESGIIKSENENSPRKQKSQNNSVNWTIVHSPEYKERLAVITEDEKVLSAIETRMKWALNNRDGRDSEELYAISLSSGQEISKITNQYYDKAVKRTPRFTKKLNLADEQGESIVLIHNHPDGLPPSVTDINNLLDNKNVCGITAGHDGSIYYYTKPLKEIDIDDWTIAIKHFNKYSQVTAEEKALKILSKKYGFEFLKL